jgi:uncharacterized protein YidB (DUF937 family)
LRFVRHGLRAPANTGGEVLSAGIFIKYEFFLRSFKMSLLGNLASLVGDIDPTQHPAGAKVMEFINQQPGGLDGLVTRFHEQGLGEIVDSWVSSGQNLPISADQVKSVLGDDGIETMAAKLGLPAGMVNELAAKFLPQLVDNATPDGTVPPQN